MRDSLGDIESQGCEAIFVEVDFLVVWNLANLTVEEGGSADAEYEAITPGIKVGPRTAKHGPRSSLAGFSNRYERVWAKNQARNGSGDYESSPSSELTRHFIPDIGKVDGYVGCDGTAKQFYVVEHRCHDMRLA